MDDMANPKDVPEVLKPISGPLSDELKKKLDDLTPEKIEELMKQGRKNVEAMLNPPEPPLKEGVCVVCGGKIKEERWTTLVGELRIGGHNNVRKHSRLHCETCGLLYQHLPKPMDQK